MITAQTENLINRFVERSKELLQDSLVGIYLHGSAVMGCFNPEKSDIDMIVVVDRPVPEPVKRAYLDMTVEMNASAPTKGIEMSIVLKSVCDPFVYPTPYELHFSAGHLSWYRTDPEDYVRRMNGTDWDLAAHFTVINRRGKCLCGAPIREVFAQVPRCDYMDSIVRDVSGARDEITQYPMYLTLNLARVLACKEENLILSKKEGGEWAIDHLPAEYRPLIRDALREYTQGGTIACDENLARDYAAYMLKRIERERS